MKQDKLLQKLEVALTHNIRFYNEMAEELAIERVALKAHSLKDLETSIRRKARITHKIQTLEGERLSILEDLAKITGRPASKLTLLWLAENFGGPLKDRLLKLRVWLREIVDRIADMNLFNRGLIEQLIKVNYSSAEKLHDLIQPGSTYIKGGMDPNKLKPGQVVSQTM
ncbi:hypothetical protein MNBD_NITROSPINAE02-1560 [hydrothermal vent metagenome]|uniref:FlgN protein n=1 Tax=hydrothermal vent metagenome TaxID=652676 RepID=A0A3B1BL66_9ZZZZ